MRAPLLDNIIKVRRWIEKKKEKNVNETIYNVFRCTTHLRILNKIYQIFSLSERVHDIAMICASQRK